MTQSKIQEKASAAARPSEADIESLAKEYEARPPEEVIDWALRTYGSRIAISTGFQAEGMVIIDMAHRIDANVRVLTIDTGRLPEETYALMHRVRERYSLSIEVRYPDSAQLEEMVRKHGMNPFYDSVSLRLLCCYIRKVTPLEQVVGDLDAWITGLRRSQNDTRAKTAKIEVDKAHGRIVKVNPLADWTHEQVWGYITDNDIPYNELYDKGYTSIGCAPCTRAVQPGEDMRAGRWWWEKGVPKECGIHLGPAWGRTP